MLNLLYYFSFFFLSFFLSFKNSIFYFFKKSFFDLSIWEKFYLILFYDPSVDFLYYRKLIVDSEVIFFIQRDKYIFYRILQKKTFKNLKKFNDYKRLLKLIKKFNLLNFWKIIPCNFDLANRPNISNLIITELVLIDKFKLNLFTIKEFYYYFLKHFFLKKNINFVKDLSTNFKKNEIYFYKINKLQYFCSRDLKYNNLKIFIKINFFFNRLSLKKQQLNIYWQLFLQNFNYLELYKINTNFNKYLKQKFPIRYNPTNIVKHLSNVSLRINKIYFLRKIKIFNKSRYSRNRQIYRTGVYWCLWLSIFLGWGLYFIFYRYTLNFSYFWWIVYLGLNLFVFVKAFNYRLYNYIILINELKSIFKWWCLLIFDFINFFYVAFNFVKDFFKNYALTFYISYRLFLKITLIFMFGWKVKKNSVDLIVNEKISFKDFLFVLVYSFI